MDVSWSVCRLNEMSPAELYALLDLRIRVFVVEQNCPYVETDGKDFHSTHLFARDGNDQILACLRVVDPGVSYEEVSIGRVATHPDARGKGLGHELMQRAMRMIEERFGPVPVRISAQEYLRSYYATYGFACVSDMYLEDDIPHIEMLYKPFNPKPFREDPIHARRHHFAAMWEDFEQAKTGLLTFLADWEIGQIALNPDDGSWDAIQVLHHLVVSEKATLGYLMNKTQAEPSDLPFLSYDERKSGQKLIKRLHSEERYAMPAGLSLPESSFDLGDLKAEWDELRDNYRSFLANLSPLYYGRFIFRHPIAGPLAMEETIGFLTGHIRHHMHQLRRIQRSLKP